MSRLLGTFTVLELQAISLHFGREHLPYPFLTTVPATHKWAYELAAFQRDVVRRFLAGEYPDLSPWIEVQLRDADIRLEAVFVRDTNGTIRNVCATRWRERGFIAVQDAQDVITVSEISAYDLGREVANMANMTGRPGRHQRVTVPGLRIRRRTSEPVAHDGAVLDTVSLDTEPPFPIASDQLRSGAEFQSTFGSQKRWGRDREKDFIGWIATTEGDYIVQPPYEVATPVSRQRLVERIDRMIAADVAKIRELRADRA